MKRLAIRPLSRFFRSVPWSYPKKKFDFFFSLLPPSQRPSPELVTTESGISGCISTRFRPMRSNQRGRRHFTARNRTLVGNQKPNVEDGPYLIPSITRHSMPRPRCASPDVDGLDGPWGLLQAKKHLTRCPQTLVFWDDLRPCLKSARHTIKPGLQKKTKTQLS